MTLIHVKFWPVVLFFGIVFILYVRRYEAKYFNWVKDHFFFNRSISSKISSLFYIIGIFLLLISLLDFRGPEEKIEADIPDQRTIIIIDSSGSMLAEDIRPNRFKKSILLARHFIKKAYGHQIAVVLFSDIQRRLVPFTDDIDLLDARVAALAETNIQNGGSNIRQAIAESIQYFKVKDSNQKNVSGNILVFSDSESNSEDFKLDVPDKVNVAIVGVGTAHGAPIPKRDKDNVFKGYKTYRGEKIISKLDETFLKSFEGKIKNYKYWVSTSFTIPTDKILNFFRTQYKETLNKGTIRTRPVRASYIVTPAIIFLIVAYLLHLFPVFVTKSVILILPVSLSLFLKTNIAYGEIKEKTPEAQKVDDSTLKFLNILKNGNLSKINKLKVAEGLLRAKKYEQAKILYEENLLNKKNKDLIPYLNYGTLLLATGKIKAGAEIYEEIHANDKISEEIKEIARVNFLLALSQEKQNKQKQEQNNKENNKQKKKNEQEGNDKKSQQSEKDKNSKKDKSGDEKDSSGASKEKDQKEEENGGQSKNSSKQKEDSTNKQNQERAGTPNDDKKHDEKPRTIEQKEEKIRQKRKMVKIPAVVKQLMSDDSQLQKEHFNTRTNRRSSNNKRKDW